MSKPNRNPAPDVGTPKTKPTTEKPSALDICRTCANFGNSGCDCCGWYAPKAAGGTKEKAHARERQPVSSRSAVRWLLMLFIFRQLALLAAMILMAYAAEELNTIISLILAILASLNILPVSDFFRRVDAERSGV